MSLKRFTCMLLLIIMASAVAALAQDPDPNMIGWWKLDDGAGDVAADSSGAGNHGTIYNLMGGLGPNGAVWRTDPDRGMVLSFDGSASGAYVRVGSIPQMTLTNDFTWAFWANQDAGNTTPNDIIFGNRRNEEQADFSPRQFIKFTPTKFEWHMNGNGDDNLEYDDLPAGEWIHHVVVKSGAQLTYYRNGVEANSGTITQALDLPMPLFLGGDNTATEGENWRGMLSDVRIYDRALADAEVKELAARPKAYAPEPADGDRAVLAGLLQWKPGTSAVLHDVYLGTDPNLTEVDKVSSRQALTLYFHQPGLEAGETYYWRVDETDLDETVHTGDVWTFTAQDVVAYFPEPASGDTDVPPAPVLTWMPGQFASEHQVYLSESFDDVNQATELADMGVVQGDATYAPNDLAELTTYYWRVDEGTSLGEVRPGPVWSFTTYRPIDDFEGYTDNQDAGEAIFQTWTDGIDNGTGSTVGYFESQNGTFGETTIVHRGSQSMPLDYNNVDVSVSEAEREFTAAQDWTVGGVDTLILSIAGRPTNTPAPLYVFVEDSTGQETMILHPDPAITTSPKWSNWSIPLADLAGVNTGRIKKLVIGVGDADGTATDATGRIYIDDIRLIMPAGG